MKNVKQSGFTLIELMIVIAIVGILSSIALPSYRDYVRKSKMAEIVTLANSLAQKAQVYYNENGDWPTTAMSDALLGVTSRDDFRSDTVQHAYVTNRGAGIGVVYILTQAEAFGIAEYVRYTMTESGGFIRGTYCFSGDRTVDELAQYLPSGEC